MDLTTKDLKSLPYWKRYNLRHPERRAATWRNYYDKHKSELNAKACLRLKASYDPVEKKKYNDDYRILNLERIRAQQREYRLRNLEEKKRKCRAWHAKHKTDPRISQLLREARRRSYQKHKAKIAEKHRKWRTENPGKRRHFAQKRRALEKKAAINLRGIKEWMAKIRAMPFAVCYYCDSRIQSDKVHFDHIVSLSKGGPHSVENLCVSCKTCNLSKRDLPVRVWITTGQQLLEL